MTKEEFLNLVYVAYNSAIKAKRESKQKMEYFAQLNIVNEDSEKAKRVYEVVVHNISRLKEIIMLPLYEKINMLTNQELEQYKQQLIQAENDALTEIKNCLDESVNEKDRLANIQNENYIAFSSENDSEKKNNLLEEGKNIQTKISSLEKDIENQKKHLEEIQTSLYELQSKSLNDLREELISKLGLTKFQEREEIKYVTNDEVIKVANNSGDVENLLQLLQEYRKVSSENYGYTITLPSEAVAKQLNYLNKDKQMIDGIILNVESFGDIYNLDSSLNSRIEHLNWYKKNIKNEYKPSFNNIEFVLENLKDIQTLDIPNFKKKIETIFEMFPKLSNKLSYNLSSLSELDTFIGRNFKGKQIEEYKSIIIDNIYEFILNLLEEELRKLSNCVKDIDFEKNIHDNVVFNSEYLMNSSKNLTKENCVTVVEQVNDNIDLIVEIYQELFDDLNHVKDEANRKSLDLRPKLNIKQRKLDEINSEINRVVGCKLQSSDLEKLLNTYSEETLEENLAKVELLQLINNVHRNAYLQKIEINDLYEFNDNFVLSEEDELEGTKKV